jgi:hypothetical protein
LELRSDADHGEVLDLEETSKPLRIGTRKRGLDVGFVEGPPSLDIKVKDVTYINPAQGIVADLDFETAPKRDGIVPPRVDLHRAESQDEDELTEKLGKCLHAAKQTANRLISLLEEKSE